MDTGDTSVSSAALPWRVLGVTMMVWRSTAYVVAYIGFTIIINSFQKMGGGHKAVCDTEWLCQQLKQDRVKCDSVLFDKILTMKRGFVTQGHDEGPEWVVFSLSQNHSKLYMKSITNLAFCLAFSLLASAYWVKPAHKPKPPKAYPLLVARPTNKSAPDYNCTVIGDYNCTATWCIIDLKSVDGINIKLFPEHTQHPKTNWISFSLPMD